MATNAANVDEFGNTIRVNVSEDISTATVSMEFNPPNAVNFTKTEADGVTAPAGDTIIDDDTTFNGNEYGAYDFEEGVLNIQGAWKVRLIAEFTSPAKRIKTDFIDFTVNE